MHSHLKNLLVVLLLVFAQQVCFANDSQNYPCVKETEALLNASTPLPKVFIDIKNLPFGCFDGYFAEGISDTVAKKMAYEWEPFLELFSTYQDDKRVVKIVIESINASLGADEFKEIFRLSASQCPNEHAELCEKIHSQALLVRKEFQQ